MLNYLVVCHVMMYWMIYVINELMLGYVMLNYLVVFHVLLCWLIYLMDELILGYAILKYLVIYHVISCVVTCTASRYYAHLNIYHSHALYDSFMYLRR